MEQLALELQFCPNYNPADFVVSTCNIEAFEKIRQRYRPTSQILGLIGAKDTGKTHLTAVFRSFNPTAKMIDHKELQHIDITELSAHSFIIDDADLVKNEVNFFHLINMVRQRKGLFFFTAQTPPSQWRIRLPDLKSRLLSADLMALQPIDVLLYKNILEKLFLDRQIIVTDDIIEYIMDYIKLDISYLRQFVATFDKLLLAHHRSASKSFVQKLFFEQPILMNEAAQHKFLGKKI